MFFVTIERRTNINNQMLYRNRDTHFFIYFTFTFNSLKNKIKFTDEISSRNLIACTTESFYSFQQYNFGSNRIHCQIRDAIHPIQVFVKFLLETQAWMPSHVYQSLSVTLVMTRQCLHFPVFTKVNTYISVHIWEILPTVLPCFH